MLYNKYNQVNSFQVSYLDNLIIRGGKRRNVQTKSKYFDYQLIT